MVTPDIFDPAEAVKRAKDLLENWTPPEPLIKADSSRTALVDRGYHWIPIDESTPRGVKLQLINSAAGVAVYSILMSGSGSDWTHFCPLPTFAKETT